VLDVAGSHAITRRISRFSTFALCRGLLPFAALCCTERARKGQPPKCMQRRSFSWRRGRVGSGPHRRGLNGEFASILFFGEGQGCGGSFRVVAEGTVQDGEAEPGRIQQRESEYQGVSTDRESHSGEVLNVPQEPRDVGILPVNPTECRSNATLRGRLRIRGWLQVLARIVSPGWAHGGPLTLTRLQCGRRTGGNILRSGSGRRLKIPAIVQRAGFGDFRTSGRVVEAAASVSAATVLAVASRTAEGCGLSGLSCTAGCEGCL